MILGETLLLQETVTLPSAFLAGSPAVAVYDSSGASVASGTPTVTPGTASTSQTFALAFTPAAVGEYEAKFSFTVGAETRIYTQRVTVEAAPFGRQYPQAGDLQEFLQAHGFVLTAAQLTELPKAAAYGVSEFERRVGRKMIAGPASVQPFDPPANGSVLRLGLDLAAAPASVVYQPAAGAASTWVLGTDYVLEPVNGPGRPLPEPYTQLRLLRFPRWLAPLPLSQRQSIRITGQWGYALDLPANAQEAMLALGALRMAPHLDFSHFGGAQAWKRGEISREYRANPLAAIKEEWSEIVDSGVSLYQRWEC